VIVVTDASGSIEAIRLLARPTVRSRAGMAISYVNGFLCTCSCDVSKAKRGEDPHPSTDPTKTDSKKKDAAGGDQRTDGPAVLYGGSLSGASGPDGVRAVDGSSAPDPTTWRNRNLIIDRLV
jgi:hypothetical protein